MWGGLCIILIEQTKERFCEALYAIPMSHNFVNVQGVKTRDDNAEDFLLLVTFLLLLSRGVSVAFGFLVAFSWPLFWANFTRAEIDRLDRQEIAKPRVRNPGFS